MASFATPDEPKGLVVEHSPVSRYLAQQQTLETPVAQFSSQHDELAAIGAQRFRELIPLTAPGAGEQYAFEVDLDRCTGCKACVAGCHSMNGLHDEETWRDVGLVHGCIEDEAYQQVITTACHHCADPACLNGCPVLAYDKDPVTGIVRHLDDQCIGCQYCVLKCPYDVPKYNASLGIVRKCDMCQHRLAGGEAPACVQACPTEAIRITIVEKPSHQAPPTFLPTAPEPGYTLPTTRYLTRRPIPANLISADNRSPRVEPAHYPLVVMLALTQGGTGGLLAAVVLSCLGADSAARFSVAASLVLLFAGLAASIFHLGRPLGAWRAVLGFRRSWLSREIVLFGTATPLALIYGTSLWRDTMPAIVVSSLPFALVPLVLAAACASIMIYVDTQRRNWRLAVTTAEFGGTIIVMGLAIAANAMALAGTLSVPAITAWLVATGAILAIDRVRAQKSEEVRPEVLRGLLLDGPLKMRLRARRMFLVAALILAAGGLDAGLTLLLPALFASLGSELIGRALYFQAAIAPRMPGGYRR